jgi:peptidoglycan/LPS O-acetylase OafA/YrhL
MREAEAPKTTGKATRLWVWLGDASYALYLVHPFVVVGVRKIWVAAGLSQHFGLWPMVGAMILASVGAALLVHEWVEKPMTAALTKKRLAPA